MRYFTFAAMSETQRRALLVSQAMQACGSRGHGDMMLIPGGIGFAKQGDRYHCSRCGLEVDVNFRPAPNEIDIGGEAVALNCTQRREAT